MVFAVAVRTQGVESRGSLPPVRVKPVLDAFRKTLQVFAFAEPPGNPPTDLKQPREPNTSMVHILFIVVCYCFTKI